MKFPKFLSTSVFCTCLCATSAWAHFGMVIPSTNIVDQNKKEISIQLSFSHPFESIGMDLTKPKQFYVVNNEEKQNLLPLLQETQVMDHAAWQTQQKIQRPGVYQYVMEPAPYWEPAEDIFIIHYTKTIVAAFGADEGWDQPVGLPTEIIPLLRPYGNYAGNSFTGQVLIDGTPAAASEVEIEFYNKQSLYNSPSDYHITQVVRTDNNGIFTFTCPFPGWWGFSALHEADYTMKDPENKDKNVELGAVLWIFFDAVQQ
jgi:cobalt/nickel transport protein